MLPDSWEWAAYSELGEWSGGGTPSKSNSIYWEGGKVPWFSPKDMRELELHDSQDRITEDALHGSAAKPIRAGSLLFVVRSGILRRTLPVALTTVDGAVNQDIKALTPSDSLSAKYLLYATLGQREEIRHTCKKAGTTVESIQVPSLQAYPVPIPPLNEQRRIVEKIEELFTKLDAGVRSLEQARTQLKSYRRSVLKAAVEGELSREWREAHRDELELASELLDRVLQERREKFAGKKYKEPAAPDTSGLPELPGAWCWSTLEQVAWDAGYGTSQKCGYDAEGPPVLRIPNLVSGRFDLSDLKFGSKPAELDSIQPLAPNDMLIIRTNGSRSLIGRAAIVRRNVEQPHYFASYLIRFRVVDFPPLSDWLAAIWDAPDTRMRIEQVASTSAGQHNINIGKLNNIPVPLPPLEEQRFIVEEVERRFSVVDKLEATVEANLRQAVGLRQSILKRAFSGELVAQDPDDEPAGVLLARIREERQATKRKARRPRKVKEDDEAQGRLI